MKMLYTETEAFEAKDLMELANAISHFFDDLYKRHAVVRAVHAYTSLIKRPDAKKCFQTMIIYEYGTEAT